MFSEVNIYLVLKAHFNSKSMFRVVNIHYYELFIIPNFTLLYKILLYCIIPYYTLLYCTVLYFILLFYIVLMYNIAWGEVIEGIKGKIHDTLIFHLDYWEEQGLRILHCLWWEMDMFLSWRRIQRGMRNQTISLMWRRKNGPRCEIIATN